MNEATEAQVRSHMEAIANLALAGDEFATKTLCCFVLLMNESDDDGPGDGETIIDLEEYRSRLAA